VDAVRVVVREQQATELLLQRKLEINWAHATHLLDKLESAGVIGPARTGEPREVLVKPEDDAEDTEAAPSCPPWWCPTCVEGVEEDDVVRGDDDEAEPCCAECGKPLEEHPDLPPAELPAEAEVRAAPASAYEVRRRRPALEAQSDPPASDMRGGERTTAQMDWLLELGRQIKASKKAAGVS
jgi:hypothetical protein